MKIGIDLFSFDKIGENFGVGPSVYVWHLLPKLFDLGKEHTFIVFSNRENKSMVPLSSNVSIVVSPFNNKFRPYRILHEQLFLPFQFYKKRLDFIHCFGNNIPFFFPCKSILTVHDLMWKYYIDIGMYSIKNKYFEYTVPLSFARARVIITVSKYIADQISAQYHKCLDKIFPVLEASSIFVTPTIEQENQYKQKYNFSFIYTVTTSMPHKNLIALLKAFFEIKKRRLFDGKLIISGQLRGKHHSSSQKFIMENDMSADIIQTGFISEHEKTYCYRKAIIFIYPSLYEGFGLPVLEAMESGTPVIASNAASIPEVGGDACLYFNPHSVEDLIDKIAILLTHDRMRDDLIEKGYAQYRKFSWEKTAMQTLNIYKREF
jgi:glycosyltransferase involved in cell wall biosynthesis